MNSSISPRTTHVVSTHGWRGIPEQWYGAHQMCCAGGRCAVLVGGRLGTPWRIHDPGTSEVRLCVCMQLCLTLLLPRVQESVRCHTLEWISACRVECRLLRAHPWPVNGRPGSGTGTIAATAGGASCDSQSSGGSRLASSSPLRHSMRRVLRRLQQRDRQATAQPQPREQLSPRGRSLLHPSQPLSPVPESPPAHPQPHQGQVDQATPERPTRKRPRVDDRRITLAPDSEELDDLGDEHGAVGRAGQRGAARAKRARQEVAWLKEQNRRRAAANRRWQQRQQQRHDGRPPVPDSAATQRLVADTGASSGSGSGGGHSGEACNEGEVFAPLHRLQTADEALAAVRRNNPGGVGIMADHLPAWLLRKRDSYACVRAGTPSARLNLNEHITKHLEPMIDICKSRNDPDRRRKVADGFRATAYRTMVSTLKKLKFKVTDVRQVKGLWVRPTWYAQWLRGAHWVVVWQKVGPRMEAKIAQILEQGRLGQLESELSNEWTKAVTAFIKIWGVGPARANELASKGYRSIAELRAKKEELVRLRLLDTNQQIGLAHYEEFQERIPRYGLTGLVMALYQCDAPDT